MLEAAHVDNGLLQFMGGFGFFAALRIHRIRLRSA